MKKDDRDAAKRAAYPLKKKMLETWENEGGRTVSENGAASDKTIMKRRRSNGSCDPKNN